jgi:hypothetical protein
VTKVGNPGPSGADSLQRACRHRWVSAPRHRSAASRDCRNGEGLINRFELDPPIRTYRSELFVFGDGAGPNRSERLTAPAHGEST